MKLSVIVNCNLEILVEADNYDDAVIEAENYELPKEYVEDSYELIKVLDENENEIN